MTIEWSGNADKAMALAAAISADDPDSFSIELEHAEEMTILRITVESGALRTIRATVDDLLACLAAAEGTLDGSEPPRSE